MGFQIIKCFFFLMQENASMDSKFISGVTVISPLIDSNSMAVADVVEVAAVWCLKPSKTNEPSSFLSELELRHPQPSKLLLLTSFSTTSQVVKPNCLLSLLGIWMSKSRKS